MATSLADLRVPSGSRTKIEVGLLTKLNALEIIHPLGSTTRPVVGPEPISAPLQSELIKNGVQYVVKSEEASVTAINEFLADGAKHRGNIGKLIQGNTQNVIEGLIKAFSALCELQDTEPGASNDQMTVNKGATLGLVMFKSKTKPAVFTSIVTPKAGAKR